MARRRLRDCRPRGLVVRARPGLGRSPRVPLFVLPSLARRSEAVSTRSTDNTDSAASGGGGGVAAIVVAQNANSTRRIVRSTGARTNAL